jgi:hypothetical protein
MCSCIDEDQKEGAEKRVAGLRGAGLFNEINSRVGCVWKQGAGGLGYKVLGWR